MGVQFNRNKIVVKDSPSLAFPGKRAIGDAATKPPDYVFLETLRAWLKNAKGGDYTQLQTIKIIQN
jgi:hypothetical protein